jgi:hypothetical protein
MLPVETQPAALCIGRKDLSGNRTVSCEQARAVSSNVYTVNVLLDKYTQKAKGGERLNFY